MENKLEKLTTWFIANKINKKISIITLFFLFFTSRFSKILISIFIITNYRNNILIFLCKRILRNKYNIDVDRNCKIGNYFTLAHPMNIVLGNVIIGDNVKLYQGTCLGRNFKENEYTIPKIGNNVIISSNAVIAGDIIIGDNCVIGANCTVTHDIESNSLIYSNNSTSSRKIEVSNGTYKYRE